MVSSSVGFKKKRLIVALAAVGGMALSSSAWALPSFARQTGWSCAACHTSYPQLTPMGRMFKLLGFTTTNLQRQQKLQAKFGNSVGLLISRVSQFSIFLQASATNVGGGQAVFGGTNAGASPNNNVQFPQQVSLFYAGEVTPHIGSFLHLTYSGGGSGTGGGGFNFDDSSIVWTHPWKLGTNNLLVTGVDVNNTPTAMDLWNTTPDWQAPFFSSDYSSWGHVPMPFIEGSAGAGYPLAGLGVYGADIFGPNRANWLYADADVYTNGQGIQTNPVGGFAAFNTGPAGRLSGAAPYIRLAYQHDWGDWNWEVGAFGMWSSVYDASIPNGNTVLDVNGNPVFISSGPNSNYSGGPIDTFDDYDFDTQLQWLDTNDNNNVTVRAAWVNEQQHFGGVGGVLPAGAISANSTSPSGNLNFFNINATYWYHDHYGIQGGYRNVWGSANPGLYGTTYTNSGSPDTSNEWIEASYLPWWNTRFSLRYVVYNKFNGVGSASSNTLGYGASAYNTLELLAWISY
ncbi:cytochrome C (plasmid) [Acidithiobacillus ferruginosus]|uniref:Cytochrome C n=1 Tax=Acidithiobacillus ferruginosus TaxID=3063951 RepID=A0ACD5IM13_9PROT|nr:cytochrome C [Acidithiobacillus ferruginosus]MBU2813917.1 cytochrome C [Acidithiobacillus ferruginosus]